MSLEESKFRDFIKELFKRNDVDYYNIIKTMTELQRKSIEEYTHFYYFICEPHKVDTREELRLVGITSLIEALMQKIGYKDVFSFFESEYKGLNVISDYQSFKKEYLEKFGATKKVREYFKRYVSEENQKILLLQVAVFNCKVDSAEGKYEPMQSIEELADFLYKMRSEFVHQARMRSLCPNGCVFEEVFVGEKHYLLDLRIDGVMKIFERSYVNYWLDQVGSS